MANATRRSNFWLIASVGPMVARSRDAAAELDNAGTKLAVPGLPHPRVLGPVVATFVLAAAHELLELLRQSAHDQQRLGQTPDARAKLWACLSRARARVCVRARVPGLGAYVISGLLADVGTRTALARLALSRPRDII